MAKTAAEKNNPTITAAAPAKTVKAPDMPASTPAARGAVKTPVRKAAAKPMEAAAKPPSQPAEKTPAAKPAAKAAPKAAPVAASKASPKASAKATPKAAVKATAKAAPKSATKAGPKAAPKAAAPKAAPKASKAASAALEEKPRKAKLVRDSFTMPEPEYAVLGHVKKACLKAGIDVKKSELLRIGVALISQLDMATLQKVLASLPQLKTGRPKSV